MMNRIYRVIRSRTYNRDVVVSEITKTTGKSSSEVRTTARENPSFKAWLAGMAAAGLLALPAVSFASDITGFDGKSMINAGDKVHNLYAQQINSSKATGSVGVSKYGKFNLTSGDIANMHFNKKGESFNADSLVNLVKDRINIEGTVNALKGNKIGGHLYFLSPEGMAVGKSGVINAGQFTAVVPSTKLFDKLTSSNANTFNEHFYDYVMDKGKIDDLSDWYSYENDQNINIEGTINTRSGIKLRASKIDIAEGAKLLSNQAIDFSSLVNTTDFGGLSNVVMTASTDDKTGDIVLKAGVESKATDGIFPSAERLLPFKTTTRKAIINVDGEIETDGDVEIGAVAKTTYTEGNILNILDQTDIVGKILGASGLTMVADVADKTNTSHITLGQHGSITSGGDTDISASSSTKLKLSANTPAKKTGEAISNALPVLSVGVINQTNNALVDIYGDIDSGDALSLNAAAETSASLKVKSATEVKDEPGAPETNLVYFSLGVIASDT
ncbi:MAG: leukotoxin LktA family filamentous adhesin, partial [Oxalobacter sp.]|nr:leukotoxin LktA family filamentous adhesin [Oxalobacter sp.]